MDKSESQRSFFFKSKINHLSLAITLIHTAVILYLVFNLYDGYNLFNKQDIANHNHFFWNAANGKLFTTSTFGSNLACHNTLFFFLILPIYKLIPHTLTLFTLKTIFLNATIIPLSLIAQKILKTDKYNFLICMIFLFYPAILSQHFAPPHEINFAPVFLLFTFYFFIIKNFKMYIIFSLLCLSIKEQLSAIPVMFGFLAFFRKYDKKWIISSMSLGISWFIYSMLSLNHFKNLYPVNAEPNWIIGYFKSVFVDKNKALINLMNIKNPYWSAFYLKYHSLNLALIPLLSLSSILCIPEAMLNLVLANTEVLSPLRHYNITVSCFLICAFIEGFSKLKINKQTRYAVLVLIILLNISLLKPLNFLFEQRYDPSKALTCKEAIKLIPANASLSTERSMALDVSSREELFFNELIPEFKTDYILTEASKNRQLPESNVYEKIFDHNDIVVYKKSRSES